MYARVLACAACTLLTVTPCAGQALPVLDAWVASPTEQADALYFAGRPEKAFDLLQIHVEDAPDDYGALWRMVRSAFVLGDAEEGWRRQNPWLDLGMHLGDQAVALRPDGIEGRYWRGAVTGRRALNAAPEYGAELAQRAYEDANAILAVDPDHGGAHNILGRIFFEVMSMSRIERWIGKAFMRTDVLDASSWEAAELHLEAAAKDWPDWVPFQYDLARLYRKRGRDEDAREVYQHVTQMPAIHPLDPVLQLEAERALEELGD
ncbi:MAG: tetratricopeptide repeat protein [Gemmatimonadota bacterium]|jgi:tetratricopeptide (TPR) repeat protein